MKISIFGTGYVGLVTGACFAELGNHVLCCDIDPEKIAKLKKGEVPFYEPGLAEIVERNIREQRLLFSTSPEEAASYGELLFIAVGTPSKTDGEADLQYVYNVAETIGNVITENDRIVVTKSTVPIGTSDEVKKIIQDAITKRNARINFAVVNNPEFLREGKAVEDFMVPDRVVVGVEESWAKEILTTLYAPLTKNGHPIFFMDTRSSEMTKYASNTLIAARISLINEIAQICELVGADIESVRAAMGADKRIGSQYLYPGVGYGGSCFPKDVQALAFLAKKNNHPATLVEAIETVNEAQKKAFASKIIKNIGAVSGKTVAVWGLSFKPKTDDMRSAPSVDVINILIAQGAKITAYDPVAIQAAQKVFGGKISYATEMYDALKGADCLVVFTEWSQFKEPDFENMKKLLKQPLVFDGRNIYDPERMKELGFVYYGIGRK